jgi:hypothetical protein
VYDYIEAKSSPEAVLIQLPPGGKMLLRLSVAEPLSQIAASIDWVVPKPSLKLNADALPKRASRSVQEVERILGVTSR